jgi:flavorubredoxin
VFAVAGERHTALIEGGITHDIEVIADHLDSLAGEIPAPRYVLPTHSEMGHSGGIGALLARYPEMTVHGDVTDLHLTFPEVRDRLHPAEVGDEFDLGGTKIVVVESVFRDLITTRWYYDTARRVLFPGDGFAFSHDHEDGACGLFAEEAPEVQISGNMTYFAEMAFHWTQFVDTEPFITRLNELIFDELDVSLVAPSHGLPIGDPTATMPKVADGLRSMSKRS